MGPPVRAGLVGLCLGLDALRGTRRRRAVDRGFVLSDHVDWPGLLAAIDATGAETVLLTHGYTAVVARWLREQGQGRASRWQPTTKASATKHPSRRANPSSRTTTSEP